VTNEAEQDELKETLAEVRRIAVQSTRLAKGVMAGGYASVFRGAGLEFDEVREFVEGDDPRLIDWKVTARAGRPYVKKFVDEREQSVLFLLDASDSMRAGFGALSARQMAVRLCACLSFAAVRNHDKTGLVTFGKRSMLSFAPPRKGSGHALRIVRDGLMSRDADGDRSAASESGAEAALAFAMRMLRRRSVVFVVSDFMGPLPGKSLFRCALRHDVVAVRIASPDLFPPAGGLMRLADPESMRSVVVDWNSERVRNAWIRRVAAWRAKVDAEFARCGVDVIDVAVPMRRDKDAVQKPILDFFRMRQLRGSKR
jgi:uncharacterized protein (DUF58 family)